MNCLCVDCLKLWTCTLFIIEKVHAQVISLCKTESSTSSSGRTFFDLCACKWIRAISFAKHFFVFPRKKSCSRLYFLYLSLSLLIFVRSHHKGWCRFLLRPNIFMATISKKPYGETVVDSWDPIKSESIS